MARVRQSPPAASEGASPVPPPAKAASLPAVRPKGAGSAKRKKPSAAAPVALNAAVGGQVALIAGLAASAFTVVALASYDPHDMSLSVAGTGQTENLVGPAGSYLADALYQGFGYAAWTVLFVGVSLALRLAGRPSGGWMKRVLGAVGFALLATGLQLGLADLVDGSFEPGGLVGLFFAKALTTHLGRVGAGLVVATGLVAIGTILFRIDWQPLAARAVERLQHGAPAAVRGVGALGVGAVRASVRAGSAGIEALRDRASGADAEDEDEEIEEEEVSAPVTRASNPRGTVPPLPEAASSGGIARRAPEPVARRAPEPSRRPEPVRLPETEPVPELPSVWSARRAPTPPPVPILEADPERDAPTKVAGRTLVEVEWEGTSTMRRAEVERGTGALPAHLRGATPAPISRPRGEPVPVTRDAAFRTTPRPEAPVVRVPDELEEPVAAPQRPVRVEWADPPPAVEWAEPRRAETPAWTDPRQAPTVADASDRGGPSAPVREAPVREAPARPPEPRVAEPVAPHAHSEPPPIVRTVPVEPPYAAPPRAEPARVEPAYVAPRVEPAYVEPPRAEAPRIEPSYAPPRAAEGEGRAPVRTPEPIARLAERAAEPSPRAPVEWADLPEADPFDDTPAPAPARSGPESRGAAVGAAPPPRPHEELAGAGHRGPGSPLSSDLDEPEDDASPAREEPSVILPPPFPASGPARVAPTGKRPRPSGDGVTVMPGNLKSGGAGDDGRAIRKANTPFQLPPLSLLDDHPPIVAGTDEGLLHDMARRLTETLREFQVDGRVTAIRPGPVITMFEYEPAPGVKLSRIANLSDNLKMALKAISVRIVAPLPGRGCVGIEIPNEKRQTVWARDVFASQEFKGTERNLPMILGKDTEGRPFVTDLAKMPHLLVGGTTGSGKSVGVNSMLVSMLFMRTPDELRMILIDPKMLEFALYEDIPHLLHPVVTEPKFASAVLKWACTEMDERYKIMARWQTRHIDTYNAKVVQEMQNWTPEKARMYAPKDWPDGELLPVPKKFPYIVIVIDELADLMMVASSDVEASISRIVAKARAAGIHLIVATQTPRRDVITGLIKANMPASLAYQVRSALDSRVILDQNGAETLLGKGDLLFLRPGTSDLVRIHGPFLSEDEVHRVADFLRAQGTPEYDLRIGAGAGEDGEDAGEDAEESDPLYDEAVELAIQKGKVSTSMLQRHLGIGYNRAANIVEAMERAGVVGPADGARPREVLVGQA